MGFRAPGPLPVGLASQPFGGFRTPLPHFGIWGPSGTIVKTVSDALFITEDQPITASSAPADTGGGTDTPTTSASVPVTETRIATDDVSAIAATSAVLDSGGESATNITVSNTIQGVEDDGKAYDDIGQNAIWPDKAPFIWHWPTDAWPHQDSITITSAPSETIIVGDSLTVLRDIDVFVFDTGDGTDDVEPIAVTYQVADSGEGTEAPSIPIASSIATDTGDGTDTVASSASVAVSDTASTIELTPVTKDETKGIGDVASGFDEIVSSQGTFFVQDVATHDDSVITSIIVPISDDGTGTEALAPAYQLPESGDGTDSATVTITSIVSDVSAFQDIVLQVNIDSSAVETMSATEQITVSQESHKIIGDLSVVSESFSLSADVTVLDVIPPPVFNGILEIAVPATPATTDTVTANDSVLRYDTTHPIVRMVFTFSKRSATFTFSKRSATFTLTQ